MSSSCHIGGIIKHKSGGYGFKTTFNNFGLAQKYKEMMNWIIKNDGVSVSMDKGYYDRKE
jgi:hypothetical protein